MARTRDRGGWQWAVRLDLPREMTQIRQDLPRIHIAAPRRSRLRPGREVPRLFVQDALGAAAPVDGWSGSRTSGTFTYATNTCCEPAGRLLAALGDQDVRTGEHGRRDVEFRVAGRCDAGGRDDCWRAGDADGGSAINASYQFWLAAPGEHEVFDQCVNGLGCSHEGVDRRTVSQARTDVACADCAKLGRHFYLQRSLRGSTPKYECPAGQGDPNNYAAAIYLYAADLTLEQTAGPTASSVGGELATSARPSQARPTSRSPPRDPGAGIYAAEFTVDGTPSRRRSSTKPEAAAATWARRPTACRRSCTCSRARPR